jgi:hypothetical protein
MRTALQFAGYLACAASLHAQIAATLGRTPDGLDEVRVRNGASSAVTAFAVTAKQGPGSDGAGASVFVAFSDPLIDPADSPLAPGEERVVIRRGIPLSGPGLIRRPSPLIGSTLSQPVLAAGILEDGATSGDAVLVARLIWRRTNMLLAVENTLEALKNAGQHNVPREQLIGEFDRLAEGLNHWYLSPEQTVGRSLYQSIAAKLRNLPEPALGEAFPPSAFIVEQTAALNKQRVALLESQPSLVDSVLVSAR